MVLSRVNLKLYKKEENRLATIIGLRYLFLKASGFSLKPLIVWPTQIPIDEEPAVIHLIVTDYGKWLKTSIIPKLLLYAKPGMIIKKDKVEEIRSSFKNTSLAYIGKGKHFIQEDQPHEIGKAIQRWVETNFETH